MEQHTFENGGCLSISRCSPACAYAHMHIANTRVHMKLRSTSGVSEWLRPAKHTQSSTQTHMRLSADSSSSIRCLCRRSTTKFVCTYEFSKCTSFAFHSVHADSRVSLLHFPEPDSPKNANSICSTHVGLNGMKINKIP